MRFTRSLALTCTRPRFPTVADAGRRGEVRILGGVKNSPTAIAKVARRIVNQHGAVEFVYGAGSCGYNVQQQLTALGFTCRICAPFLTPQKPGDRIRNDHATLSRLPGCTARTNSPTCGCPDTLHEPLRDLFRIRRAACQDVRRARIRIQAFLFRCDLRFEDKSWSQHHGMWLCNRQLGHPTRQFAF